MGEGSLGSEVSEGNVWPTRELGVRISGSRYDFVQPAALGWTNVGPEQLCLLPNNSLREAARDCNLCDRVGPCHPALHGHLAQGDRRQSKSAFWSISFFFSGTNGNFHGCCQMWNCFPSGTFIRKKWLLSPRNPEPPKYDDLPAHSLSNFLLLPPPQGNQRILLLLVSHIFLEACSSSIEF